VNSKVFVKLSIDSFTNTLLTPDFPRRFLEAAKAKARLKKLRLEAKFFVILNNIQITLEFVKEFQLSRF